MPYMIGKTFLISVSHQVPDEPTGHPSGLLHGHNLGIEVVLRSEHLVEPGFVMDFGALAPFKKHLQGTVDHRHLNDIMSCLPTEQNLGAELAGWASEHFGRPIRVHVWDIDDPTCRPPTVCGFWFRAAHQLPGLPDGHKCARLHGHGYTVEVALGAQDLDAPAFLTDLIQLAPLGQYLATTFNYRPLNDVLDRAPTSENLAAYLAEWVDEHLPAASGMAPVVRVHETPSTWAQYARTGA